MAAVLYRCQEEDLDIGLILPPSYWLLAFKISIQMQKISEIEGILEVNISLRTGNLFYYYSSSISSSTTIKTLTVS